MHCAVIVQIKEHVRKNKKLFSKTSLLKMFVFVPVVTWCNQSAKFSASADSNKEKATITLISPVSIVLITVIPG